jgi:peptide-methionine (S)-S-oxide reductase
MRTQTTALVVLAMTVGCVGTSQAHLDAPAPKPALDLPLGKPGELRTLVLAAGCFWCTEAVFESLRGVTDVTSGYSGGTKETASYGTVSAGATSHAESIKITYDSSKISYGQLLQVLFTIFDPTTLDRQGPDAGHQYRSAIFVQGEEKRVAEAYIKQLDAAKIFPRPIVTRIEPPTGFYPAEEHHQNYVRLHPDDPYVRQQSIPKLVAVRSIFPDLVQK